MVIFSKRCLTWYDTFLTYVRCYRQAVDHIWDCCPGLVTAWHSVLEAFYLSGDFLEASGQLAPSLYSSLFHCRLYSAGWTSNQPWSERPSVLALLADMCTFLYYLPLREELI